MIDYNKLGEIRGKKNKLEIEAKVCDKIYHEIIMSANECVMKENFGGADAYIHMGEFVIEMLRDIETQLNELLIIQREILKEVEL